MGFLAQHVLLSLRERNAERESIHAEREEYEEYVLLGIHRAVS
jgi:hypothetical protein